MTTTIEITDEQRRELREDVDGESAKGSLQTLLDAYKGRGELSEESVREIVGEEERSEGRVRELVREEVRVEALE